MKARKSMLDVYLELRSMYDENDGNTQVFYFKNTTATFSSFTAPPETMIANKLFSTVETLL